MFLLNINAVLCLQGAFWGMMVAFVFGMIRMSIVFAYQDLKGDCYSGGDQRYDLYDNSFHKFYLSRLLIIPLPA